MKKGIPRNVVWLGFVSLFNDMASEMIYPIIPLFLTAVLGAPMMVVGVVEGIAEATASLLKVFSGWFSDLTARRKPFAVFGYSFSTLSKLLLASACFWPIVLLARFIDRFGKGVRVAARDALIAEATPEDRRGAVFGFHRAMDTMGAIGGPLIAVGLLTFFHADYRSIFLLSFIPALTGVLILQFFVSEGKAAQIRERITFRWDNFGRQYNLFLLISFIFSLGNSSDAFLILRSKDLGLPALAVIFAYIVYNLFYAAFSYPAGLLADRIGFRKVLLGGFLVFTLVYYGFGSVNNPHAVWLLFAVYGFYIAFTEGVAKAYISNLVPAEKTGTAIGLYYTVTGAAILFASLTAGWLWTVFGPRIPFYYGAFTAGLASVLFVVFLTRKREIA